MPYCGQFGCSCCSQNCSKCGKMNWRHELDENNVCKSCLYEEACSKVERLIQIRRRLCQKIKTMKGEK